MILTSFFRVFLRKYLTMKSFLLCLLTIPLLVAGGVYTLDNPATQTSLVAGVVNLDQGEMGEETLKLLLPREDISFVTFPDRQSLMDEVICGTVAVGYVLGEEFSQSVVSLQQEGLVERIALEGDIYHQYVNELVYTAVYAQMVPYITAEFLEERGITPNVEEISVGTLEYQQGDLLFTVDILSAQGVESGAELANPIPLIRGILAMGLLLISLMGAATTASQQRGWALFAPHLGRLRCEIYAIAPIYALGLVSGLIALVAAALLSPYEILVGEELLRLLCYQLALGVFGLALPRLVGRDSIVLLIPFLLLFLLVTHPILLDVTVFLPQLKPLLQWLPSYLYMTV